MTTTVWHYLNNTFIIVTNESTKLMMILSPDHRARLFADSADPEILAMLNDFIPLDDALALGYQNWGSANGFYRGATLSFENKLKDLSQIKLNQWIPQVQVVYPETSPEYLTLFPNGRAPFNTGAYDIRINTVKTLGINLAAYPLLATTKTDVNNYYDSILAIRSAQQVKEEDVRLKSEALEVLRVDTGVGMYKNLGLLMAKFSATPELIAKYFDLSLIQNPPKDKDTYSGMNDAGVTDIVLSEGIVPSTTFKLYNNGETHQKFFTSNPGAGTEGAGMELPPHTNATATAETLGNPGDTQLNVKNLDAVLQGIWSVVVM